MLALALGSALAMWSTDARGQPFREMQTCDPYVVNIESGPRRLGADLGFGWRDRESPVSTLATSLAVFGDRRISPRFLVGARAAWFRPDIALTAGPRFRLLNSRNKPTAWWELGAGGGVLLSTSGRSETGPMAEVGLALGNRGGHVGARYAQGFAAADDLRVALFEFGFNIGGAPEYSVGGGCPGFEGEPSSSIPFAIGFHAIVSGLNFGDDVGYQAPAIAFEVPYYLRYPVDLVARWDLLVFPSGDLDVQTHHSALAGARLSIPLAGRNEVHHLHVQSLVGYDLVTGTEPHPVDSGPVVDVALGYALFASGEGVFARIHGRFGLSDDNRELRGVFLSVGGEIKNAEHNWYTHVRR